MHNLQPLNRRSRGKNTIAPADREPTGSSPRARTFAAVLAVIVLAAFPIVSAVRSISSGELRPALGPVDRHIAGYGRSWELLQFAATHIPVGSSYTVRAPTPNKEMVLFMIAVGQLRGRRAYPSSYFTNPLPHIGAKAQYVIVVSDTEMSPEPNLEVVATHRTGSVFRRAGRP